MLRVFVRAPSLWLWPFFVGLGSALFREGMVIPWLVVIIWGTLGRGRILLWSCLLGACWGMFVVPISWSRLSWTAWVIGDDSARVLLVNQEMTSIVRWRQWGKERVQRVVPAREASLATALLYGENGFSTQDKRLIRSIGLSHLTAVSGANLSFLLLLLLALSGWRRASYRVRVWLQQSLILGCVLITGATSSMVRAGVMASVTVWARAVGRRSRFLRALIVSALLIACIEPRRVLVDLGWQFSLLACCGLAMASGNEERPSGLFQAIRVSVWAWVWTLPVQLWRFQEWSWVGVLGTILLTPIVELIQVGTVCVLLVPHSWTGHLLEMLLSSVWKFFEVLASVQSPIRGATGGFAYLLLYIPLIFALIHKMTQSWGRSVSRHLDTSTRIQLKGLGKWILYAPNFLDTSPDLVREVIISILKASASTNGR